MRSDLGYRVLDNLYPTLAEALLVSIIVERNYLVLKQAVDSSGVELVLIALVLVCALLGESPTGTLTIAFNPPTIKNREVNHTVHLGLLTRCAGSLERTGRSIHPDIDTRYQATGKLHIVVLEEDNLTEELWTLADFKDLLDKSLSGAVSGVRLTREEEEHWMLGVVNNLAEAIQVGEEQVGALVSSKTTAEANHQRVGVDALQQ